MHKGSSTNSRHYISMVKVGDIWFECDDVKITKIEFNNFCNSDTVYMLFYQRRALWNHLRGIGLVPMDTTGWVSWGEGIKQHTQQVPPDDLFPFLGFIHFCYLFDLLAFVSCCSQCLLMLILLCSFWTYIWSIQWSRSLYVHYILFICVWYQPHM